MGDYGNKRPRGEDGDFRGGRGRGNFGSGGDRGGRGGGGGGRGNFSGDRGGRGGGSSGGPGGNFRGGRGGSGSFGGHADDGLRHKTAGGDAQRMPEAVENRQLVAQKLAPGQAGTPVTLLGNFYRIVHQRLTVHHYDVTISKVRFGKGGKPLEQEPRVTSTTGEPSPADEAQERFLKKFADSVVTAFVKANPELFASVHYAYDGWKSLYTTSPLNMPSSASAELSKSVEMPIDGRPRTFQVSLKRVDSVALGEALDYYNGTAASSGKVVSERIIAVFEVIFRFVISRAFPTYQRKFFDLSDVSSSPKARLVDFVQGFIDSVRVTEFGLALNLHLKTSAVISKRFTDLLSLVGEVLSMSPKDLENCPDRRRFSSANKIIRHLKIFTKHGKREIVYSVDGLVHDKFPHEAKFENREGRTVTVADYFRGEYGLRLLNLPLVKVTGKKVLLPLELCYLKDAQFLNKTKFDSNVQREMLFKSTHTPNVYFHKVAKVVASIKAADSDGLLGKFGLELTPQAARITGRVLPTPRVLGSNQRDRFYSPAKEVSWGVFCFDNKSNEEMGRFAGEIKNKARLFGLALPEPTFNDVVTVNCLEQISTIFENVTRKTNAELIFVGIPMRHNILNSSEMYAMVKHCCDQRYGIVTQCFKADNVSRPPNGYFDNLLLKVNGKAGGQNVSLEPKLLDGLPVNTRSTMVIGVDVNHPGETERVMSSVAAAVGSYDQAFALYNASIRVQAKQRDETIKQLDLMVSDLLRQYKDARRELPSTLVVFRDGVSEGQFARVVDVEIPLIRRACAELGAPALPFVLIVVQKRHHTRFALAEQNTAGRKPTYNVPSGTVVDRDIVDPTLKSFYLNSHFSPLGTSKPTKYVILHDDLNMDADALQQLCFYSCFSSTRTRSVIAIPTAVRYADLAAYRAKLHIEAQRALELGSTKPGNTTLSSGSKRSGSGAAPVSSTEEEAIITKLNCLAHLHEKVKHRLFYC